MYHIFNYSTVYFTGMMVFTLTSQMYHRISVLVPVLVRVPEYLSTSTSTSTSIITLELKSTSTVRVPEIQYSSTVSTSTEYEYPSPGDMSIIYFSELNWNHIHNSTCAISFFIGICNFHSRGSKRGSQQNFHKSHKCISTEKISVSSFKSSVWSMSQTNQTHC